MAYCTFQDLVIRYGAAELNAAADRDGDGQADEEIVSAACEDAAAEIDARIARRYRLPLEQVPTIVKLIACDIARYRLLADRPHEQAIERYKGAVGLLDAIAAGTLTLATGALEPAAAPGDLGIAAEPSLFPPAVKAAFTGGLR